MTPCAIRFSGCRGRYHEPGGLDLSWSREAASSHREDGDDLAGAGAQDQLPTLLQGFGAVRRW